MIISDIHIYNLLLEQHYDIISLKTDCDIRLLFLTIELMYLNFIDFEKKLIS